MIRNRVSHAAEMQGRGCCITYVGSIGQGEADVGNYCPVHSQRTSPSGRLPRDSPQTTAASVRRHQMWEMF